MPLLVAEQQQVAADLGISTSPATIPVPAPVYEGLIDRWTLNEAVDGLKRAMIEDALRESGSKTGAARKLGIPRQSLQKMMNRLEME